MRVILAASVSPFSGREEMHWTEAIRRVLSENKKYVVDTFMLPIVHNPLLIPEQMTALRLLDIRDSCDMLLTIGFPAFVLKHPDKRVLLFSLAPSLHEHFDTEFGILSTPQYQNICRAVQNAEKKCLLEAKRVVCASRTLSNQLKTDFNITSTSIILGDRLQSIEEDHLPENGPWIVCESMLEPAERMDLLLSAVSHSMQKWRLLIFVPSASDVYRDALNNRIERLGIKQRVDVFDGSLRADVLNKASAYVALHFASTRIPESTLRAVNSAIPMVTTSDSNALLEVITPEANGLIVEPNATKIGEALDMVVDGSYSKKSTRIDNPSPVEIISDVSSVIKRLLE